MKTEYLRRRRWVAVVLALAVALSGLWAGQAKAAEPIPGSMASLGDSITRAYNTSWFPFIDASSNSWSTGTSSSVNSLYRRFLARRPEISGRNSNYARSGARMNELAAQAGRVGASVEYVTVLMGANDVCASSEGAMTPVGTFRAQFQTALNMLTANNTNSRRVYVISIPNVYRLWEVLYANGSARLTWALFGICQSMLANPTSFSSADVGRRTRVLQRNIDFNSQLMQVCALYRNCHFDGNAAFNTDFLPSDVSTRDYFHPSLAGQAKLALTAWNAGGFTP